jgi:hypothetical protein
MALLIPVTHLRVDVGALSQGPAELSNIFSHACCKLEINIDRSSLFKFNVKKYLLVGFFSFVSRFFICK